MQISILRKGIFDNFTVDMYVENSIHFRIKVDQGF